MEEKYESFKQKILKLNELALRGEEGEKRNTTVDFCKIQ